MIPLLGMVLLGLSVPPGSVQAQVTVSGQVREAGGAAIENATVALSGYGFRLTSEDGTFRFEGVEPGQYTLRVEALGYALSTQVLEVQRDVQVTVSLEIAPFQLDSLVADLQAVGIEGRVWDPEQDRPVYDAEIVTDQVEPTRTSGGGRFKLQAWKDVPLTVRVRAFRYLPLDTLVVPGEGSRYAFELAVDPLVERMLSAEIARLDDRAGGRRAVAMGPLDREDLRRWTGATLRELLQARFPQRGRRIRCIVVDERTVSPAMLGPILQTTFAEDVERIEFLFRGAMLRIYTREFMRRMLGGGLELRSPVYSEMARPPLCR